jgi:hypothetical protein
MAVYLFRQWILHDWNDDECVNVLKNCKQAIPPRDAGGKIIIIDMVVGSEPSENKNVETHVLYDILMMNMNGVERDEKSGRRSSWRLDSRTTKLYHFSMFVQLSSSILEKLSETIKNNKSIGTCIVVIYIRASEHCCYTQQRYSTP